MLYTVHSKVNNCHFILLTITQSCDSIFLSCDKQQAPTSERKKRVGEQRSGVTPAGDALRLVKSIAVNEPLIICLDRIATYDRQS